MIDEVLDGMDEEAAEELATRHAKLLISADGTSTGASAPRTAPLAGSLRVAEIECQASWL